MSDPFDRLRGALGEVPVPDQWAAIESRAALGDTTPGASGPSRTTGWWVAAAAAVAVLLAGVVVIARLGDPAATNPNDTVPPPPTSSDTTQPLGGRTITCDSVGDLEQVLDVLSPGVGHLDYGPKSDPTTLFAGGDVVVVANLARVSRSGDYARIEFAGPATVLAGEGAVDAISLAVPEWGSSVDTEGPDPLAGPVALEGVRVAASLRSLSAAPVWTPELGGLFVGCADSDVPAIDTGNQAPLSGAPSIDMIVDALTRSEAPTSTPPTLPGDDGSLITCTGEDDLDAIIEVLRSGLTPADYEPADSLDALLARSTAVAYGGLRSAHRSSPPEGSLGLDPARFTQIGLTGVEMIAGDATAGLVMGFELPSVWSARTGADPLGWSSTFDGVTGVSVVAFVVPSGEASGGWTVDPQGLFVACSDGSTLVRPVLEPAEFLDHSSIDALAESVRLADAPDPALFGGTCIDRTAPYTGTPADPPEWQTFGPLGAEPGLRIELPAQASATAATTSIERVPGGVLVVARVSDGTRNAAVVALVGHDGALKWRRCLLGYVSMLPWSSSSMKLRVDPDGGEEGRWMGIDLATGELGETVAHGWPIARSDQFALFEVRPGATIDAESRLVRVDMLSNHELELPYPPETYGQGVASFMLVDTDVEGGAVPVLLDGNGAPVSAYVDGEWGPADPSRHRALAFVVARLRGELVAWFSAADGQRLEARNGLGEVVWRRPDLTSHGGEGFQTTGPIGADGSVVIVRACESAESTCEYEATRLMGVSATDGHTLWQRGAGQSVAVASGDFAVVTVAGADPATFEVIDVNTGERVVDSPTWDSTAFYSECCGGGEYFRVGLEGALARTLAADYWSAEPDPHVKVWYPAGATAGTIVVDLLAG